MNMEEYKAIANWYGTGFTEEQLVEMRE